ncbi:hypothetical protein CRE_29099 [Caenorhabditis remanei]|uniref:Uncharacterized protein n=1 Tax=Caenorhabditis remanei TaxID=31234 RepID=E3N4I4_CAERE|nr:hypothetical protein CRE_29099 [Caenorhabditis remanei]
MAPNRRRNENRNHRAIKKAVVASRLRTPRHVRHYFQTADLARNNSSNQTNNSSTPTRPAPKSFLMTGAERSRARPHGRPVSRRHLSESDSSTGSLDGPSAPDETPRRKDQIPRPASSKEHSQHYSPASVAEQKTETASRKCNVETESVVKKTEK